MGNSNKNQNHNHEENIIISQNTDKLLTVKDLNLHRPAYYDLKKTITDVINFMGPYQMAICLTFILNGFIYGINHNLTAFHVYTPAFYCEENGNKPKSCLNLNGTCPSGFRFNQEDDHTPVSQWSLVCQNQIFAPLINTMYYCGVTLGALINGILADKYGRKKVMIVCLFSQGLLGVSLRFASAYEAFVIIRTLQGFFIQGVQASCIALLFEYSPPRLRVKNILGFHYCFSFGAIFVGLMSYLVKDWHMLQIVITIPSIIIICYIWTAPESMLWYLTTNRKSQALALCLKTAKLNRDKRMINEITTKYENELSDQNFVTSIKNTMDDGEIKKPKGVTLTNVCQIKSLRKHLILMSIANYIITLAFYVCLFSLNHLNGNRHVNFIISSCVDVIAYSIMFFSLKRFGTRSTEMALLFLMGSLMGTVCLTKVLMPNDIWIKNQIVNWLLLIAKGNGAAVFCGNVLYTAELFPTVCRGSAVGTCGFFSRIGSVAAPFLMILAEYYSPIVPLSIICGLILFCGILITFLPSTLNVILPQSIKDAQELWDEQTLRLKE